ncbi:MAG: type IV pilus assembly protein PilM [Parcubacteria group bacterium]
MANFLSSLQNVFTKKSHSVLGIDIGSSCIKIVQLSRSGGHPVLDTYGELSLGQYAGKGVGEATNLPLEKIIEAMNDILREKEVNITTKSCGMAIPFSSSLMTVIDMPDLPQKQLNDMVPLEARKYIPVPISEVSLDWYAIPKDENPDSVPVPQNPTSPGIKSTEVLIVALHNDTITKYKDIVSRSSLEASFFEIEIFSTMRSVLDQETVPVLMVDMGATSTKLYIVEKGILRSSHMINRGSHKITDELSKSLGISMEEAEYLKREKGLFGEINGIQVKNIMTLTLDYIFSEANQFLLAYQKRYKKNVGKAVLIGGGSALKGIVEIAKDSFQTELVAGDPFSKVVAPAFLEKVLRDTGPEFAVAVGIALRKLQEVQ